jgi:hypothetical protein
VRGALLASVSALVGEERERGRLHLNTCAFSYRPTVRAEDSDTPIFLVRLAGSGVVVHRRHGARHEVVETLQPQVGIALVLQRIERGLAGHYVKQTARSPERDGGRARPVPRPSQPAGQGGRVIKCAGRAFRGSRLICCRRSAGYARSARTSGAAFRKLSRRQRPRWSRCDAHPQSALAL